MLTTMHTARVVIAERRLTPSTVTIVRREEKLPNALWLLTAMEQVNHTSNHKGIVDAVMLVRGTFKPATISAQLQIATSNPNQVRAVSYTHLRAHETDSYLVCRLL